MIDPRISLAAQAPQFGVGSAINIFENALMNSQTRDLRQKQDARAAELHPLNVEATQQGVETNQQALDTNREQRIVKSLNDFAVGNASIIADAVNTKDPAKLQDALIKRRSQLVSQGLPTETTDEGIAMLGQGNIDGVVSALKDGVNLYNQGQGRQGDSNMPASIQETLWFNEQTPEVQAAHLQTKRGEQPTFEDQLEFKQAEADIDIATTEKKENIKNKASRTSALVKQYSTDRRAAKTSMVKLRNVTKLMDGATQGVPGQVKLLASRFFPGIDASDEGALSSGFKSLALDELQKFKGPTTDFEFAVTEDITGSLGQGASANKARVASLKRAAWFSNRQAEQFDRWVDAGHNPDRYAFNMDELVTFGKGDTGLTLSLQDIQDTAVANHMSIEEVMGKYSKNFGAGK